MPRISSKAKTKVPAKTKAKVAKKKEYQLPKLKFRKNGVSYKEGDIVEVSDIDGVYIGVLHNILSSQLFVQSEDDPFGKFFFHRGLKIRKL